MDLSYLGRFDRIYAYARVSSEEQADKRKSLDGQVARLNSVVPAPDHLYQDVMGGDEVSRPGYQALKQQVRADCLAGLTVMVVITELDRIARDASETSALIDEWDDAGAFLFALDGGRYSGVEPHDWLRASQEAVYAEYFLRSLRRRLRKVKQQRRESGWPVVMNPPMGYTWTREKLLPDPEVWERCRRLVGAVLPPPQGEGLTLNKLAQLSIELGLPIKTPHGLKGWLLNPILRGHLAPHESGLSRKEQKRRGKGKINRSKTLQLNRHEPLISEGEYLLIQARLEDNRRYARNPDNSPRYPLSGLIRCGYCQQLMTVQAVRYREKRYLNYECRNLECERRRAVSARKIEAKVIEAFIMAAAVLAEQAEPLPVEASNPEIPKIKEQIKSLEQIYKVTPLESIQAAIDELKFKLNQLSASPVPGIAVNLGEAIQILSDPAVYTLLSDSEKRTLYHDVIDSITCRGSESIVVTLKV